MAGTFARLAAIFIATLLLGQAARGQEAAGEVTAEAVRDSLDKGVAFLFKQQGPDGSWPEYGDASQPTGLTSLCTLALLNCGITPKNEPRMAKALAYLEKSELPRATYSAALQVMVFTQADPVKYKVKINELAKWLEANQVTSGETKGGWNYGNKEGSADNSNAQFALLALHEAERAGVKINDSTWRLAEQYWVKNPWRRDDGSWGYFAAEGSTGSMTCAGIASLIIAQDHLAGADAAVIEGRIRCCGNREEDDAIQQGIDWLGRKFQVSNNPTASGKSYPWLLYYLYGVERVGRMSGKRFFGSGENQHDWYREGSQFLVEQQKASLNGSWQGTGIVENNPLIGTSLALLFLSKGRRPVVMARLQHSSGTDDWNHHRRSVQNLVWRIERQWERDLSWQTIDLKNASVEDLLEAPVLFISGGEGLTLLNEQGTKLRDYVQQGGFIFAEACNGDGCDGAQFDRDFRALMVKLFPESALRRLPPDHAVWFAQESVDPKHLPKDEDFWLWGLDACCRTSVIYCPRSLSCRWELSHPYRENTYPIDVKNEIEACVQLGGNVVAYATNRQLKEKLERPQINIASNDNKTPRGALVVPKLSHAGGADDAPSALANLLLIFEKQLDVKVDHDKQVLLPNNPKLLDFPLAFLHGRRAFAWNAAERKALKDYLDRGGLLFADSICASKEFADSFRAELKAIYPSATFVRIDPKHAMFTEEFHGFDVTSVTLRDPQLRDTGDPLTAKLVKTAPLLEGLEVDGRIVAILSPYDISCALEKGASLECKGYIPEDAARLGANVILYALQQE